MMKSRPLRHHPPSPSVHIVVAVDEEVLRRPQHSSRQPLYRDYCLPIVASLKSYFRKVELVGVSDGPGSGETLARLDGLRPHLVFNCALSTVPSEASFIGALELLQIPFTGAGQRGMLLSRDKPLARAILRAEGITVPHGHVLTRAATRKRFAITFPAIVKPALYGGSSRGIFADSVVTSDVALRRAAARLHQRFSCDALCEEFVVGREFRVAAIKGKGPQIQFVGTSESVFGRAKPGWGFKTARIRSSESPETDFGVNVRLLSKSDQLSKALEDVSLKCLHALDIRGPATVDIRVNEVGEIFVLEVNANPGISARSQVWGQRRLLKNLLTIVAEGLSR